MHRRCNGDALVMLHNVPVRTAELVSRSLNKAGAETQHNLVLVHQLVEVLLRRLRHLWHNKTDELRHHVKQFLSQTTKVPSDCESGDLGHAAHL